MLALVSIFFNPADSFSVQSHPRLFESAPGQSSGAENRRRVSINFRAIHPETGRAAALSAELPDRTVVLTKARVERRGEDDYTWYGAVEGHDLGTAVLTVVRGMMRGYINIGGEEYSIEYDGDYIVTRQDPSLAATFEGDELAVPETRSADAFLAPLAADDGTQIDVLVLYTAQMAAKPDLAARIQNFVNITNAAYVNSGIGTQLRVVHQEQFSDAGAAEGIANNTALNYITGNATVAARRTTYGADLVTLLRVHSGQPVGCGIAWVGPSSSYAHSVVEVRSASEANPYYCSDLTFAHELGHNLGCAHDRANASVAGAYSYSYGYYNSAANLGTVMSYLGSEILYFSTPLVLYSGNVIGLPEANPQSADNARTINNTRTTVASFKSPPCAFSLDPGSGSFTSAGGSGSVSVTTGAGCGWSAAESLDWVSVTGGGSGTGPGSVQYTVNSYSDVPTRIGTMSIGGQTFTITQTGVGPHAAFTASPLTGSVPLVVSFSESSTNSPSSWSWSFGDSGISSERNPVHTFKTAGTYTVALTVSNGYGPDTMTRTGYITVSACPTADTIRVNGVGKSSIVQAYTDSGGSGVIKIKALGYSEILDFALSGAIRLEGGYNCSFDADAGFTEIPGPFTVRGGAEVTLDRITIL